MSAICLGPTMSFGIEASTLTQLLPKAVAISAELL